VGGGGGDGTAATERLKLSWSSPKKSELQGQPGALDFLAADACPLVVGPCYPAKVNTKLHHRASGLSIPSLDAISGTRQEYRIKLPKHACIYLKELRQHGRYDLKFTKIYQLSP
jgi:hypothetical protein